jgi:hypothetical protein
MTWNDVTILVSFEPDWLGLGAAGLDDPYAHLELQALDPPGAPLPMGDNGYWSEFMDCGCTEEAGGPVAVAEALLNEFADTVSWRAAWARWEQRDLFA